MKAKQLKVYVFSGTKMENNLRMIPVGCVIDCIVLRHGASKEKVTVIEDTGASTLKIRNELKKKFAGEFTGADLYTARFLWDGTSFGTV